MSDHLDSTSNLSGSGTNDVRISPKTPPKSAKLFQTDADEKMEILQLLTSSKDLRIHSFTRAFLQFLADRWRFEWYSALLLSTKKFLCFCLDRPKPLITSYLELFSKIFSEENFPPAVTYKSSMENVVRRAIIFSLPALEFLIDDWTKNGRIGEV